MSADIPTTEPTELRAGLTWEWTRSLADYPAPDWVLTYWFKKTGSTAGNFSIVATADGADHAVLLAAATSQAYVAGAYTWAAVVTAGSEAFEVDRGTLELLARYDQAANVDDRSHARIMLDAIEAELEGRATTAQLAMLEYGIGIRNWKGNPDMLLQLRDRYRAEVRAEEVLEAGRNGRGGAKLVARL